MEPFRPINNRVAKILGPLPNGPFNYGLFFNKWFMIEPIDAREPLKCQTERPKTRSPQNVQNSLADNLPVSMGLFNEGKYAAGKSQGYWDPKAMGEILMHKLDALDRVADSYQHLGYQISRHVLELQSPLVIGLGGEHPTEKGFRFDWNLGLPMIPASSIKGVVRLAHLIDELNQKDQEEAEQFWREIVDGILPEPAQHLFGCGENVMIGQNARRGRVIFLDAFPAQLPQLKAEIMNCHYKDYLNEGKRGPTEDQDPNPQRFWAVASRDRLDQPLGFVFYMLIARELAADTNVVNQLNAAFLAAAGELGFGAKTAIGHGLFSAAGVSTRELEPAEGPGKTSQSSAPSPEKLHAEQLALFETQLRQTRNLAGDIEGFLNSVQAVNDPALKVEMAQGLIASAKKQSSFKKARKAGKQWVRRLEDLAKEMNIKF